MKFPGIFDNVIADFFINISGHNTLHIKTIYILTLTRLSMPLELIYRSIAKSLFYSPITHSVS